MTRYIPKPIPVEAMQWLGPDDPEHVEAFEAWACEGEPVGTYAVTHSGNHSVLSSGYWEMHILPGDFVIKDDGGFTSMSEAEFLSRYTPAQEGE